MVETPIESGRRGCVTQLSASLLQARIGRRSLGCFSSRQYGSLDAARTAARRRIDQVAATLPPPRCPSLNPQRNNRSTGVRGISRDIHHNRRRDTRTLRFQVVWIDDHGRTRSKSFTVGRIEHATDADERHAYAAALAFRRAFVAAYQAGEVFDPTPWQDWRSTDWRVA